MLALKRRLGEVICLKTKAGEVIRIVVQEDHARCLKFSIDAPKSVEVERGELAKDRVPVGPKIVAKTVAEYLAASKARKAIA